jgi:hypothetical protein
LLYIAPDYDEDDPLIELWGWAAIVAFSMILGFFVNLFALLRASNVSLWSSGRVTITYWRFFWPRRLELASEDLSPELTSNHRLRAGKNVKYGTPTLSLIHRTLCPDELIIASSKRQTELHLAHALLAEFFPLPAESDQAEQSEVLDSHRQDLYTTSDALDVPADMLKRGRDTALQPRILVAKGDCHVMVRRRTVWSWLGYGIAVVASVTLLILTLLMLISVALGPARMGDAIAPLAFASVLLMVSLAVALWMTEEILQRCVVFDKDARAIFLCTLPESARRKKLCDLDSIMAIQMCLSIEQVERRGQQWPSPSCQINLVLKYPDDPPKMKRINVSTSPDKKQTRSDAEKLAEFLNVRIIDHM